MRKKYETKKLITFLKDDNYIDYLTDILDDNPFFKKYCEENSHKIKKFDAKEFEEYYTNNFI